MSRRFSILVLCILIVSALGVAAWLALRASDAPQAGGRPAYHCPMHPEVTSDEPGASCPICGMDLVSATGPAPVTVARSAACACCR